AQEGEQNKSQSYDWLFYLISIPFLSLRGLIIFILLSVHLLEHKFSFIFNSIDIKLIFACIPFFRTINRC
ncbi:hypothetical protein, partial [Myroides odoratimimus]|uniref:hypothetical protein n=1 Tax=Myroides odoratimimus TaxID=76832 RepID=UPI003101AAB9